MNIRPDQMIAAGSFINREYGYEGYAIEAIHSDGPVTAFRVRCSDGGRFFVIADRWGNCESMASIGADEERFDNPSLQAIMETMYRKASTI